VSALIGKVSLLEELLAVHLSGANCPVPERQYRFDPHGRRFLLDFAWPEFMVAVEVQGGQWTQGRHNRPEGYESDCEKRNLATFQGWRVYYFTGRQVTSGEARDYILKVLGLAPRK